MHPSIISRRARPHSLKWLIYFWNMEEIEILNRDNEQIGTLGLHRSRRSRDRTAEQWKKNTRLPQEWLPIRCYWCDIPGNFARDCNHPNTGWASHSRRQSEEKSTGYKSSNRNEQFRSPEMLITKREKRFLAMVRETELHRNQAFQREVIIDSGAREHVISDELYLTDVKKITSVTVKLAYKTSVAATKWENAELQNLGPNTVLRRAFRIP